MIRRPGRQGLFWTVVLLLALVAGIDLLRGRDSVLGRWWSDLRVTRGEASRSYIQRLFVRGDRRR